MSFIATRRVMVFAACMSMLSLAASHAATTVFMDYTNFSNQLNTIALSAGVPSFTPAEELEIKANILGYLQTAFDGFDVSFSESPPGGDFPTLTFALSGGGFGQADHIDYRNKQAVDTARDIYHQFRYVCRSRRTTASTDLGVVHFFGRNVGPRIGTQFRAPPS